jgi:hypothetical protein
VLVYRHQAFVPAPVPQVWELVGRPERHPEWWPEVVEVQGTRFGRGCSYCHVTQDEHGVNETTFVIDRLTELKELAVRCAETGMYMRWAPQRGAGRDARGCRVRDRSESATEPVELDAAAAGADLRRWLHSSLDGLAGARS